MIRETQSTWWALLALWTDIWMQQWPLVCMVATSAYSACFLVHLQKELTSDLLVLSDRSRDNSRLRWEYACQISEQSVVRMAQGLGALAIAKLADAHACTTLGMAVVATSTICSAVSLAVVSEWRDI